MTRQDNLRLQVGGAGKGRVEVGNFKPEEHAVSGCDVGIADGTVMILLVPGMELKDQLTIGNEPLVVRAAMGTLTAKETLIPATTRFDIARANKRLWMHGNI